MRVLIAQPQAMLAEGVARVVRGVAPRAVIVARGKDELLASIGADAEPPAAVIVAYPWISLASLRAMRKAWPAAALIVTTRRADATIQRRLLASHVAAVIPDTAPPDLIAAALRVVQSGEITVQGRCLALAPPAERLDPAPRVGDLNLTARQFDVLMLIAAGRANREIAGELGIGVRTVKGHVAVILRALHVGDRRAARVRARRWLARRGRDPDRRSLVPALA